ncbi:SHOCT domain-containing protein [Commensalibacter oyaizuii]|uniref:SHOCT domain-containing protein n=1 Tax=Commensalibacter oyaizuii TaxID=3043873 RepID=A0ABT6Q038_9PROT|nr:SHOCT domain-containing protein [Commensalibacter sp. TBRC 16381]MDI2090484.1 SHOCT domain-containing protein [Commensalibacter sp. TBRC 16381]
MSFNFRDASVQQRTLEFQRVARLNNISFNAHQKYFDLLTSSLGNDEEIRRILTGYTLAADKYLGQSLLFLLKNRMIFVIRRLFIFPTIKTIYLEKINSLEYYSFTIRKGIDVIDNNEQIQFVAYQNKDTILEFIYTAHALIEALRQQKVVSEDRVPTNKDVISDLERLGILLEKGILTQEEFAQQKAKILNDF